MDGTGSLMSGKVNDFHEKGNHEKPINPVTQNLSWYLISLKSPRFQDADIPFENKNH
jgi:hypothetical protein